MSKASADPEAHQNQELADFTYALYRQPSLVEGPIEPEPYRRVSVPRRETPGTSAAAVVVEEEEDDELEDQVIEVLGTVKSPLSPPSTLEKKPIGIQVLH